jgi:membrane glycosyltransferase
MAARALDLPDFVPAPSRLRLVMDGDDFRDDIARIEARIEELGEAIERCRKLSFAAKLAIGAGSIWLALTLLGLVPFVFSMVVAAMAAAIGGIVLLGSNATTWQQTESALRASEALRAELIGRREMRVVEDSRTVH